ncbi:MAG: DUF6435 family protein [Bacteroidota bacterium]
MFGLFKKNPTKRLEQEYRIMMEEARDIQRSGDLRAYAAKLQEAEAIMDKIEAIRNGK